MPELRKDPVTGRWVIISTDRRKRPTDFHIERSTLIDGEYCPFCAGREEIDAARGAGVPSERRSAERAGLGPARRAEQVSRRCRSRAPSIGEGEGLFDRMNGIGAHEVIIETPDHEQDAVDDVGAGDRAGVVGVPRARAGSEAGFPVPLHPAFQESRRRRGGDARALALAADRAADRARLRARGNRGREAALRGEGAVRVLRHHPAGGGGRASRHPRERRHRRALALRAAVSVRDVAAAEAATARGSRRRRGSSTRAWRGCSSRCCCGWIARSNRRRTT